MPSYFERMTTLGVLNSKDFLQWVLCLFTLFLSAGLWNKKRKLERVTELVEVFPGPKRYWILGSIRDLVQLAIHPSRYVLDWHKNLKETYGPICKYWVFDKPIIVLADAELAIKLYNEGSIQGKSSVVYRGARLAGGEGLLALPPEVHVKRKKQWMPSFTRKQVEMSMKFFREQAIRLCDELNVHAKGGNPFDLVELSVGCTFRAICYSAFGEEYMAKLPDSVGKDHMHDLHTVSLNLTTAVLKPWTLLIESLYFNATRNGRETRRSIERGNLLTKNAVQERKKYLKTVSKENQPKSSEDFECFLDHMLELMKNGHLTEREVIQELNVFIAAGYDTSGITICFVLYFLSLYPEHQERIVEELRDAIPPERWDSPKNYSIDVASTKDMKYLELCIKETLRLYPVLPISPRSTTQEVVLPDGRILPAGVDVFVLLYEIHQDPKYFPEPKRFLPERHLQPNPAFMPFTLGNRNCIGQVYTMYEMKVILAYLLMTYKWETMEEEGFKTIYQTLQVPENGMRFKITKRSASN